MKLTHKEAVIALKALCATDAYNASETRYAAEYAKRTGIVPEWVDALIAQNDKWIVTHEGKHYATFAKTRDEAVNNVRYRIYGETPERELAPFVAMNPAYTMIDAVGKARREADAKARRTLFGAKDDAKRAMTKDDAVARIRRMTR